MARTRPGPEKRRLDPARTRPENFLSLLGPFSPFFGAFFTIFWVQTQSRTRTGPEKETGGPGPDPTGPKQNRWTRPGPDRKTFLVDHRPLVEEQLEEEGSDQLDPSSRIKIEAQTELPKE